MTVRDHATVAIVGAGPRGTSVLERIVANRLHEPAAGSLTVHIIDPFDPGAGHIWRTEQSRLFLMNTPSFFPTVVPTEGMAGSLAPSPVPVAFEDWRVRAADGRIPGLDPAEIAEAAAVGRAGFPSRALYGRYLRWVYAELERCASPVLTLRYHQAEVLALQLAGEQWVARLDNGVELSVDSVVLALGHVPAKLSPEQENLRDSAARFGVQYWPPAVPGDVEWKTLPAGKSVLVRGLGLNFFDTMIQLSEGRGGQFVPAGSGRLDYRPSGREPLLVASSRRGVPYRAKADLASYIPRGISLRYCTAEALLGFAARGIQPGFDHDFWPLLHRDVLWAYYSTLARVRPQAYLVPAGQVLEQVGAALNLPGPEWAPALEAVVQESVPAASRLDVEALGRPFQGRKFPDNASFVRSVLSYLEADVSGSARGEDDPLKMAIGALNAGRSVIKQAVADGGLTDVAWESELRGWFEPLVEGLASGPPSVRIAQLAALVRAGLVQFLGPNPNYVVDAEKGLFCGSSPWVKDTVFTSTYLVDAMMPANQVSRSTSVVMRQMLDEGLLRPRMFMAEGGVPLASAGLDVTAPPYRALDSAGQAHRSLYVLGLQLASVQWGTAIAAEAGAALEAGARTLRDANDIARAILQLPDGVDTDG